jgi:co-chaperonin GroES (HSP10)
MIDKRRVDEKGRTAVAEQEQDLFDLIPRHEWVLIREISQGERTTDGGVVLPGDDFFMDQMKSAKNTYAQVLSKGSKVGDDINVGDVVLVTKFTLQIDGVEQVTGDPVLRLVRDEEIYCRVVKRCK